MQSFLKFSHTLPGEILKISSVILIVLLFNQGIAKAIEEDTKKSGDDFSVIGTVVRISDSMIYLKNARGTKNNSNSYSLNIEGVEKIVTKEGATLLISDIRPGNVVVVDGVIQGEKYFAQKIAYFSNVPGTNKSSINDVRDSTSDQVFEESEKQSPEIEDINKTMDIFGEILENGIGKSTEVILEYLP